jgi:predicted DNA-binding transcriptional regulator AlpA
MTERLFITADEVAELTGYTNGAAFLRDRCRLEDDLEFPDPMPTQRRPMRWRRDAVLAWRDMVNPVQRVVAAPLRLVGGRA